MSVPFASALIMYLKACIFSAFLYLSVAPLDLPWLDYCANGFLANWFVCASAKSLQSRPTLCNPVGYRPPGSSVHGILQERILEWVAIFFSRRSSWPRDWTQVSLIVGRHFTIWATVVPIVTEFSEPLGTPLVYLIYLVLLGYLLVILALSETKERTYPGHTTSK